MWVKRDVSREEREAVQRIADEARAEAGLRAADFLGFAEESRRWYPQRETVAHITGFVNAQGEGDRGRRAAATTSSSAADPRRARR